MSRELWMCPSPEDDEAAMWRELSVAGIGESSTTHVDRDEAMRQHLIDFTAKLEQRLVQAVA